MERLWEQTDLRSHCRKHKHAWLVTNCFSYKREETALRHAGWTQCSAVRQNKDVVSRYPRGHCRQHVTKTAPPSPSLLCRAGPCQVSWPQKGRWPAGISGRLFLVNITKSEALPRQSAPWAVWCRLNLTWSGHIFYCIWRLWFTRLRHSWCLPKGEVRTFPMATMSEQRQ